MTRRQFLIGGGLTVAALAAGGSVASAYRFDVVGRTARLRGLRAPLRVAFLADLHYGPFIRERSVSAWVDAALREEPDLIVLGGDLVDHDARGDLAPLLRALARLHAPLGVYAVWGNHDHSHFGDLAPFRRSLRDVGITVLVNEGVALRDDVYLAGIDDLRRGEPDLAAALVGAEPGRARVLLSHNPDVLPDVPPDAVELTLSGHTHGGQVCLPYVGPLVTSSRYGRRFAQGWVRGPARGYVSRGLGVSWLPVRIDCTAELTLLTLEPEDTAT